MTLSNYIKDWDKTIASLFQKSPAAKYWGVSVQTDFIPEPFIGDPDNCSFVIVNLNPGAGTCHSCFKKQNISDTLIHKVKTNGYSKAVKDFPYLRNGAAVGLIDWNNSPGRKWWKSRERWIKHILNAFNPSYNPLDPIPDCCYPFAMELFAWHTDTWPRTLNNKMKKGEAYGANVYNDVFMPLYEAIKKSKCKTAFCVGKPIGEIIDSFNLFTKTNSVHIPHVNGNTRDYEIYQDGKGCYIVTTWAQGGNYCPDKEFEDEEKKMIQDIIKQISASGVNPCYP